VCLKDIGRRRKRQTEFFLFFLLEAKKEFTALRGVPERHREEKKKIT
jgi:hypothetical protein